MSQKIQEKNKPIGKASLKENLWTISARANAILIIKRVLPRVNDTTPGQITIADSPRTAEDLLWISQRYPLEFDCPIPIKTVLSNLQKSKVQIFR